MGVKIGKEAKVGDYNAIGENASVKVDISSEPSDMKSKHKNGWIFKYPFLSAVIASIIAGLILMFTFWGKMIKFIEQLLGI